MRECFQNLGDVRQFYCFCFYYGNSSGFHGDQDSSLDSKYLAKSALLDNAFFGGNKEN